MTIEDTPTIQIATLEGVLEFGEEVPVELWMNGHGKVFVRAYNEGGQSWTDVEAAPLVAALRMAGNGEAQ